MAADLLVAGSDDGRMDVWNLTDRQLVHSLVGHAGLPLVTLETSWSPGRGRDVISCLRSEGTILAIKVLEGGASCLSLAADCSLRGWSLGNGRQLLCIRGALDPAPSAHLHLSEEESLLFVCSRAQVRLRLRATPTHV